MRADFVIIGGGISGAAAAFFLSEAGRVVLIEQESHFGTHSSGRTAGQFTVGISADTMRAAAAASRSFFQTPPEGFAEGPLVTPRGSLTVARRDRFAVLDRLEARIAEAGGRAERLDRAGALAAFPALRPETVEEAVLEVDAADIDVDRLLQGYLRGARRNGAQTETGAAVTAIHRAGGLWVVDTATGRHEAPVLVNAAGGWSDRVAALAGVAPIGLTPYRRTAFTFPLIQAPEGGSLGGDWPHVTSAEYDWYVKPEAGCFMGSPADAHRVQPGEMYPEDFDVALGIHAIERDTRLTIRRPLASWAGMRSFVADRNPVCGMSGAAPGFVWLAGQGGCGVLTSPALGRAVAAIACNRPLPDDLDDWGLRLAALSPDRPGLAAG
ncbi:FAD-binding oxidoreductase [Tistrella mobilis]|uniref:NAD(P)/FAD-dependent oxidoreductase n=1 Tax=Tistrella mobilis TaxID=171437 RepID=UPI003556BC4A